MTAAIPTEILESILILGDNREAKKNRFVCQRWNSLIYRIFERRTWQIPLVVIGARPPWILSYRRPGPPSFLEVDLSVYVIKKLTDYQTKEERHIDPNYAQQLDLILGFQRCKGVRNLEISAFYFEKNIPSSDLLDRLVAMPRTLRIRHITVEVENRQNELELSVLYRMIEESPALETFRVIKLYRQVCIDGFEKFHRACLVHPRIRKFGFPVMKRTLQQQYNQIMILLHSTRSSALVYEFQHYPKEGAVLDRYLAYSPQMSQARCTVYGAQISTLVFEKTPGEPMVFFLTRYRRWSAFLVISKIEEAAEFHDCIADGWTREALSDIVGRVVADKIAIKIVRCSGYFFRLEMSCKNPNWAAAHISRGVVDRVSRALCRRLNNSLHKSFAVEIETTWQDALAVDEEIPFCVIDRDSVVCCLKKHYFLDRELYAKSLK